MAVRRVFHPVRLLGLASAMLAALAGPGAVRGGCGDSSHAIGPRRGTDLAAIGLSEDLLPVSMQAGTSEGPSRPCRGPSCSRRRAEPPSPIATAQRTAPERGLIGVRLEPPAAPAARTTRARIGLPHEPPTPDHPDRPPRA